MKNTANRAAPIKPPVPKAAGEWGRATRPALLVLMLLSAGAGSWAFFEFFVWNTVPAKLVGTWVVTEGPQEGAAFDFYRNGKMIGHVNQGGKAAVVNASISVEGDKIYSTTRHPQTGQEKTIVQTIRTLTAKELVVEDARGQRLTMERAD